MTRGILSSQMQTLPACYFKLIPKPSDWAYFFYFSASNITFLALLQVQLKNLLPPFYTPFWHFDEQLLQPASSKNHEDG